MTNGELIKLLESDAIKYKGIAIQSLRNNAHAYELSDSEIISQTHVNAILVDFINYIAYSSGMNLGLRVEHIK